MPKRHRRVAALRQFVAAYGRKARNGTLDPNDRCYDRDLAAKVGRMRADKFDALLRDDEV